MKPQTIELAADEVLETEQVGGDLSVESWDAAEVEARGDAIRIERRPGAVAIFCGGDLALKVPKNAHLSISSVGGNVRLEHLSGPVELKLVGGDAGLKNLTGAVRLMGMIGGDVHMENVTNISMSPGTPGDRFDTADRVRRKTEQATRRAESKIRKALFHGFHNSHVSASPADSVRWGFGTQDEGSTPVQAEEAVSDEERMVILKMLQDKKITSEQAEQLLSALEGKA